ncbi:MAG: RNA-binding cell elongation regulator Jag/EloR [Syntrophaceae bacterium]
MSNLELEIEAKNVDEAIEKACREFNVPREKLNIEILSAGSSGLLGIGARKARIRASLLTLDLEQETIILQPEKTGEKEKIEWPEKPEKADRPERQPEYARAPKEEKEVRAETPNNSAYSDLPASDPRTAGRAKEILEGILARMGLDYPVEAIESEESVTLRISGDGSGLLIGRGGQTLDAIQYIINKAINKARLDRRIIILDTEEYRGKREEYLLSLASKLAGKVKRSKKPVTISNMSARDRRIIHLALKDDPALLTKSRGEGAYRKIVIIPNKKEREQSTP